MVTTALIIVGLLIGLILTRVSPSVLFVVAIGGLYASGKIEQSDILRNLVNPSVLVLILLMIVSLALERSAILPWLSSRVFLPDYKATLFRLGLTTALSSAFLNNTAVVATLMSAVQRNQEHSASRLLLPLSYFAILGGTITLIGTSTNLVVNALLVSNDLPALHFLTFVPVGLMLLIGVGLVTTISVRGLSAVNYRQPEVDSYFIDAEVKHTSKLVGRSVRQNGLRALDGLFLAEIVRDQVLISPVTPETVICANDKLVFTGDVKHVGQIQKLDGVEVFADFSQLLTSNLTEVIVSPESVLINRTLKSSDFRSRFDAAVVAINRQGQRLSGKLGEQKIQAGDKLVLAVGNDFSKRQNLSRNFFFISGKQILTPYSLWQNVVVVGGFITTILCSVMTPLSLLESLVGYLAVLVFSGLLDGTTIRRRFPFELWLILVCALSIAQAFTNSGVAGWISSSVVGLLGHGVSPYFALVIVFIVTVLLTEVITNTAAAAIMVPIGLTLAQAYSVNMMPFVMAVAYAASACFISPYGYQTNLMVMNAGNYQFSDFIKAGWKVSLTYMVIALVTIPMFFPF
ncbi:SLC13 family permease [Vibrio sp. dsl-7]|uniref:SLC13 family permease n=1 Tax=Vibrio chanodichtyis TaxID=3027932 RepID=A0ABT5V1L6_9VIBR|nr:SLC13 family permease [Vibrio chanodichtyis]MDE1515558.1 SLC13 family permease [Vibrio chanodichtyis]